MSFPTTFRLRCSLGVAPLAGLEPASIRVESGRLSVRPQRHVEARAGIKPTLGGLQPPSSSGHRATGCDDRESNPDLLLGKQTVYR